ncbi:hypothetical protein [Nocardia alni]|uniref:hypothetical protein n=1 Tax=Nocardia alni TaxID=2815723 RepID=UPI001C21ACC4|nr:hypothetical protein [Nocardia alni]
MTTAGPVQVNPTELRAAAKDSSDIQTSITNVLSTLQNSLTMSNKAPWGNDSFGHKFANGSSGYLAVRDNLFSGLSGMASTFGSIASGQNEAADELSDADNGNAT